jgi:serine/threonine protein phosphatase PrpC
MANISFFGRTDVGLVRPNNEDALLADNVAKFCLVADGMGGAAAGETASRIFVQTTNEIFNGIQPATEQEALELVQASFLSANDRILEHVKAFPQHQGMGCTAELLAFSGNNFVIGHMGDSRTYRLRGHHLKQLTKDHSLVQDQIDQGIITVQQARSHAMRNVILRAVGVRPSPALDTLRGPTYPGDLFMLCSDGLSDMVEDQVIGSVLALEVTISEKVDQLIGLAKDAGGKDNITILLALVS